MNEKIEQLKKEAFEFAVEKMPVGITNDPIDKVWKRIDVASDKFAELIVRECADVCLSGKNKENWRCTDSINKGFSDAVLEHFGVEE